MIEEKFSVRIREEEIIFFSVQLLCSYLIHSDEKNENTAGKYDEKLKNFVAHIIFVISEVLARVRAVLRRSQSHRQWTMSAPKSIYEPDITINGLRIDRNEKLCYLNNQEINLTKTEFDILLFLISHRNRIHSREAIIRNVWSNDVVVPNPTIDTNIARLRKKIGSYGDNIVTRLGFGYGFKETV